ncbi:MAG: Clp protease-domain-containing protein [Monoraphidium minutum]|nr:MAG: Clp protease-domain-containing protein [Monoraphidium minutum]
MQTSLRSGGLRGVGERPATGRPGVHAGSRQQQRQQHHLSLVLPGDMASSSRRGPEPVNAQRRSPVIAPDIAIGNGDDATFMDLYNYLLRQRIIFLSGYVNDKLATQVVGSLLALEAMDDEEEIRLYINSPGGQPYSIIGLVDTMQSIKPPIKTVALGAAYSYASLLVGAGTKGRRYSMKNTRIMMTQPMGGSQGDIYQIAATVAELNAIYQLIARYYMQFTGMSADEIERATNRDTFMTPEEALQVGLIDGVIRGDGGLDFTAPPGVVRDLEDLGFVDRLTGGVLKTGRSF